MADTTNLVTPKAAEGQAQTYEGDAAAMPQVRGAKSLTIESLPSSKTTEQLNEEQLEKFLDVNLDTQERRDFKRKVSKWKLMISMVLTVFLETLICLGFYAFFIYCKPRSGGGHSVHGSDRDEGAGNKSAGWPSLAGVSTVLTIIGAALPFPLVFSLGWTSRHASFPPAPPGTLLT